MLKLFLDIVTTTIVVFTIVMLKLVRKVRIFHTLSAFREGNGMRECVTESDWCIVCSESE